MRSEEEEKIMTKRIETEAFMTRGKVLLRLIVRLTTTDGCSSNSTHLYVAKDI